MCRTAFVVVGLLFAALVSMAGSGCDSACLGVCENCGAQGSLCCGDMLCLPYQTSTGGIIYLCGHNDTICNVP